ncbi:ribonuclease E/G [Leucobacter sp. CSA2]|uniref:Ribonuclease E n=1 Tax=Leucobacter edaphi TaxID=2796472 RepID=A0A934UXC6_9MICO|nr:Rne/Rng family ribonuclease [Leucobacter edaphi]MBK0421461.1 ribonuclease E/G [Leucobacter edaphi]
MVNNSTESNPEVEAIAPEGALSDQPVEAASKAAGQSDNDETAAAAAPEQQAAEESAAAPAEVAEGSDPQAEAPAKTAEEPAEAPATSAKAPEEPAAAPAPAEEVPEPAEEAPAKPEGPQLILPLAEMTSEERFRATTRLLFVAPDVPPIQPRPRRTDFRRTESHHGEFRQLDDILDQHFTREQQPARDDERDARHDRDRDRDRDSSGSSRRTRRRSDRDSGGRDEDDSPRRSSRQAPVITEPQKVKGSTRLEAKKQRRRDGRDAGRRRMVITESEFLARREAVDREMIVRTTADRVQIGVLEDKVLVEHYVARSSESSLIGNVYLGRVQNVLPSMEAAFVDIGRGRNAVLYSGEVDWSEFEGGNTARRIENALKPGDQVLVQVTKDPVGHKGARLTSQISLPGRFLVYVPGGAMNGISRKLPDTERARLKKILKEVLPTGAGVIVRTAAEGASEEQLTHDVQRLTRQWESIQKRVEKGGAPALLHSEPDMLIKIVRDVFNEDFQRLLISGGDTYGTIENYLSQVAPDLLQRVERFEGERDIFDEFRITEQIAKALDRKVWLPSGGSLVIDRTEAMTVIDVNTGKFVGSGGNLEETVTKNNLEAAEEIVRQLRLRDIGGIIVVDFIDMVLESNRDLVLRRVVECLSRDRTKHQVAEVTSLGLVQMTRKKLGLGLLESFSEPCEVCAGRGIIVHHEPVSKHHRGGDSAPRNSKRGRGGNQSGGNGGHGGNQNSGGQQHAEPKGQAHTLTDGAKNMLAQVAASTIPGSKEDAETQGAPESKAEAGQSGQQGRAAGGQQRAGEPRGEEPRATGRVRSRASRAQAQSQPAAQEPEAPRAQRQEPSNLLDSVLDALPDAPAAGTGRAKNRRVTTSTVAGGTSAGAAQADTKSEAQAAQAALAEALDATVKRRATGDA